MRPKQRITSVPHFPKHPTTNPVTPNISTYVNNWDFFLKQNGIFCRCCIVLHNEGKNKEKWNPENIVWQISRNLIVSVRKLK